MPWSRRRNESVPASWEVWVKDSYDGMTSDLSTVFAKHEDAERYKTEVQRMGDYAVSLRASHMPVRFGQGRMSFREAGIKYR